MVTGLSHFIPTVSWSTHGGKTPIFRHITVSSHYPTRIPNKIPIVVAEKTPFFQDYPIILM